MYNYNDKSMNQSAMAEDILHALCKHVVTTIQKAQEQGELSIDFHCMDACIGWIHAAYICLEIILSSCLHLSLSLSQTQTQTLISFILSFTIESIRSGIERSPFPSMKSLLDGTYTSAYPKVNIDAFEVANVGDTML